MDKAQFWQLIEDTKAKSDGECDLQVELLKDELLKLTPEEIISFDRILDELRDVAYRWDLWGGAYLINGGASDDGFEYFRCWLIAQGREIYEGALENPDSLANVIEADFAEAECEGLLYVANHAYQQKTQRELPINADYQASRRGEPAGTKWQDEDLDGLFPKITAKIGV